MVINAPNGGRLGNKMFYYAFSYILARRLGYRMIAHPVSGFKNTFTPVDGKEMWRCPLKVIEDSTFSMDEIVKQCSGKRVITHGAFERTEYYYPERDEVFRLFNQSVNYRSSGVVFHFRGSDYVGQQKYTTADFYIKCWNLIGRPSEIKICTDDLNDPTLVEFLIKTGVRPPSGIASEITDFILMRSANVLVIPRSTFSWWAAFLSKSDVIQPVPVKDEFEWRDLSHPDWFQLKVDNYFKK